MPGFEGYEVSSRGRVRSYWIPGVRPRRVGTTYRILTGTRSSFGYQSYNIIGRKPIPVHVLIATAFHGPRPAGGVVRHLDGNPQNNAATNIAWGTPAENVADRDRHKRERARLRA